MIEGDAAATMSTIESTAPTSWKCTCFRGRAVHLGFRLGEHAECGQAELARAVRELVGGLEHGADLGVVASGLRSGERDVEAARGDAAAGAGQDLQLVAVERQGAQAGVEHGARNAEVEQGGDQHVAGGAAERVDEEEVADAGAAGEGGGGGG